MPDFADADDRRRVTADPRSGRFGSGEVVTPA